MEILEVVFVIIGAIIGAGFASGKEIYLFFFSYGIKGIYGIIIATLIIGMTIYEVLKISVNNDIKSYDEFLQAVIKNKKIKQILNIVINIFVLISFYIMIAAFGTYINQNFDLNKILANAVFSILCFIILCFNINGFVRVNKLLIPLIIIMISIIRNCELQKHWNSRNTWNT